jgi:hypothetical protein
MVKHTGTQLSFLAAGSLEQAVIDDEHILTIFSGQLPDGSVDDSR